MLFYFKSVFGKSMAKLVAIRLKRDIEALLAYRKPIAKGTRAVSAFCYIRPLADGDAPLLFLIHATKRGILNSNDRNKQKRRMREAVRSLSVYDAIQQQLTEKSRQALVLLRTSRPPSTDSTWKIIYADLELIGNKLTEAVRNA